MTLDNTIKKEDIGKIFRSKNYISVHYTKNQSLTFDINKIEGQIFEIIYDSMNEKVLFNDLENKLNKSRNALLGYINRLRSKINKTEKYKLSMPSFSLPDAYIILEENGTNGK